MVNFILKRLIQAPIVMLVLSILLVGLTQLLTVDQRVAPYIRSDQQAAQKDAIIRQRGLDKPFLVQYWRWLNSTLHGDLGFSSASGKAVTDTIAERLPATIELTLVTALPIVLIGIWMGTTSALHKDGAIDQLLRVFAIIGYSLPSFVLGIVLLAVFYGYLGWLPGPGRLEVLNEIDAGSIKRVTGMLSIDSMLAGKFNVTLDLLKHMLLPALTLIVIRVASFLKMMRNQMLEALSSDYVRTARAKGLPARVVNNKHARRNALMPIVTMTGTLIIGLLSGAIITETIFGYPGIGQWLSMAAMRFDMAGVLGFAMLTALIVVVTRILVDITYGLVDPRVRFD